jgi:hypothetical protein
MKTILFLGLAAIAQAAGIEGTVWYDSKGKVAWVEGPAANTEIRKPFVPHWVAYEQRRDRALRGGYRPYSRGYRGWPVWGYPAGGVWLRSARTCHRVSVTHGHGARTMGGFSVQRRR